MRVLQKTWFLAGWVLGLSMVLGAACAAQQKPIPDKQYEGLIYSLKGPELYHAHCAPCHGLDGKGEGPVAPSLKEKPSDLTLLAKSNGGKFPQERAGKFILGDLAIAAHGTRQMPVWGPIFHQIEEDRDFGSVRIQNLLKYLESIQQK